MALKVEIECELYDHKTLMDAWAYYKYNPFIAGWFLFTETAIKSNGIPTARFHTNVLVHNSAKSSTKQAEVNIMRNDYCCHQVKYSTASYCERYTVPDSD